MRYYLIVLALTCLKLGVLCQFVDDEKWHDFKARKRAENPLPPGIKDLIEEVFIESKDDNNNQQVINESSPDNFEELNEKLKTINKAKISTMHWIQYGKQQEAHRLLLVCNNIDPSTVDTYLDNIDFMLEKYKSKHQKSVESYLIQCRKKAVAIWTDEFTLKLKHKLAALKPRLVGAVNDLTDKVLSVSKVERPYFDISIEDVKQGYLSFIKSNLAQIQEEEFENGKELRENLANSFVVGRYFLYNVLSSEPVNHARIIEANPDLTNELTEDQQKWITKFKICNMILENWESVIDFVQNSLPTE